MEYVISNRFFKDSQVFGDVFYSGKAKISDNSFCIFEGYKTETKFLQDDTYKNYHGAYNIITYFKDKQLIEIKNDFLGQFSLYYYFSDKTFIVSNNIWKLILVLNKSEVKASVTSLKEMLFFHRIPSEGDTFFQKIRQLPASTELIYDLKSKNLKETKTWKIIQKPDNKLELLDAVNMLDNNIHKLFDFLEKDKQIDYLGFGNSGGLDSRLIPLYAKEHNIKIQGYTIGNKRQRGLFTSISHKNAEEIAKHLNFKTISIESKRGDFNSRMLLDIRNNPLSGNQVFKNPFENFPDYNAIICGGNGFLVSNDSNAWKAFEKIESDALRFEFVFNYMSKQKFSGNYSNSLRIKKFLNLPYTQNSSDFLLNKWFNITEIETFSGRLNDYYNKNKDLDNFSFIRNLHLTLLNKQSPNGGLESINRTRKFYYLYYPFALEDSLLWKSDFFYERKVLTGLLKLKDPTLASIPDQKLNRIGKKTSKIKRLTGVIARGSGMESNRWVKQSVFKSFAKNIFDRKNELFDCVLPEFYKDYKQLFSTHPYFWLDVLKIKKICDIIYFEEYDFVVDSRFIMK